VKTTLATLIYLFLFVFLHSMSDAQTSQSGLAPTLPSASAASFYYISKPGELTMQINIWGSIHNPGRYEVPSSTDLIQLVSYAGGPNSDAQLDHVRVTRFKKKDGKIDKEQYFLNLEDLYNIDQSKLVLYPGDTIFIDHSSWATFRDVLTVVTTAAIITTAVANIVIAERR